MRAHHAGLPLGIVALLGLLLTACGSAAPSSHPGANSRPPSLTGEELAVVEGTLATNGAYQATQIVALHPGTSASPVTLPVGLVSQDHRIIVTAGASNGQTRVAVVNAATGAPVRTFMIPAGYTTQGEPFATALLSPDGRWLVLRREDAQAAANQSTIVLVDTQAGKVADTFSFAGDFDLDAISPDGTRLYVLERVDAAGHYHVRLFQIPRHQLMDGYITDKVAPKEAMYGAALTRLLAADGHEVYTLYVNLEEDKAFIHILPVTGDIYLARCIDLPVGNAATLLRYYSLALSQDGSTLYAANGMLGVAVSVSLQGAEQVFSDNIITSSRFSAGTPNAYALRLYNGAALSADQQTLYVVGAQGIWALGARDFKLVRQYLPRQSFTSLALGADGKTLYAAGPSVGLTALDLFSGQAREITGWPVQHPWGIAWVSR
jgi:hypothetical protein